MLEALRNWPRHELLCLPFDYYRSLIYSHKFKYLFSEVHTFCMFLGHSRSGHSLIASVLDAHPNIAISDEARALKYASAGFSKNQIYSLLVHNSLQAASNNRERAGYKFAIPNQHQGSFQNLMVIGDKDGSFLASQTQRNFSSYKKLATVVENEIKVLHIYRNPFDFISTMYRRANAGKPQKSLDEVINYYFRRNEGIQAIKEYSGEGTVFDLSFEELFSDPGNTIMHICEFLKVDTSARYLADSSSLIFEAPRKTRSQIPWTTSEIDKVMERKSQCPWLDHYTFVD